MPNVLDAKTSKNVGRYLAVFSEGEKFCRQKTQVFHESNTENKGQRRLTDGWLICLMRLIAGQIDLCAFEDHNFSEADRHLCLFFIFLRKADGEFVLSSLQKKVLSISHDHKTLEMSRAILVSRTLKTSSQQ